MIFIDFETKGLNGPITEACAVNETGKVVKYEKDWLDFDAFMSEFIENGEVVIFWHHFMPIYLSAYQNKTFNKLKGKFLTFVDFYSIFDGVKQPRYSIEEITNSLTGRNHKGNAKDDALDLWECFIKMK